MMNSKKQARPVEAKPQSKKKVWVVPALEIIGSNDIESGTTKGHPEGAKKGTFTYYS